MSNQFMKKNIKLSLEFGNYLSKNPSLYRKIPNKGTLVFTIKGDRYFNRSSWSLVEQVRAQKSKFIEVQKQGSKWEIFSPTIV